MSASQDQPRNTVIVTIGIVTAVVLFFIAVGTMALFDRTFQKYDKQERGEQPNQELIALRNHESETLNNYAFDSETGKYRIPIDRAIELEVQHPWRQSVPFPPPTPKPTPTPAPTPAATPTS